jgi:hypothetical protein
MIEQYPHDQRKPSPALNDRQLETRDMPALFLRFESPRLRVALPYASLLKIEIALRDEQIELAFATHRVTVRGANLWRMYEAISLARATQIAVYEKDFSLEARLKTATPFVSEIRIDPLEPVERRRQ